MRVCVGRFINYKFDTMTEETIETIILGHITKELKDEIQIGRQVTLAKTIMQALRIHGVVGQSEQLICPRCKSTNILSPDKDNDAQCIECAFVWAG